MTAFDLIIEIVSWTIALIYGAVRLIIFVCSMIIVGIGYSLYWGVILVILFILFKIIF